MKAIRFRDVRPGDVVSQGARTRPEDVMEVVGVEGPPVEGYREMVGLCVKGMSARFFGLADKVLLLVRRPWPEGKTEEDMLDRLRQAARRAELVLAARPCPPTSNPDPAVVIAGLREALDAYELGKPSASE